MQHDVIVVGAGPGGATAAYELARRGLRVALFEQKALPRYKPCGGCLSLKIDRILDLDFRPVVERTVSGATFTFEGLDEVHVRSERPVAYMVMRDRFDHFLTQQAQQAGAKVHEGVRVLDVTESAEGVHVTTDRGVHEAQYLVGADGANGIVARAVGLAPRRRVAVCVEAEVATAAEASTTPRDEVRIEFGAIPFGYGWVFPKGDHLSIGVGGLRDKIGNPRALYDEFLVDQDITKLPYPDQSFDVALCTWTLETLADPRQAVQDLLRVIADDGFVIYAFSSRPEGGVKRLYSRLLEDWAAGTLRGRFLSAAERPYHSCEHSRLMTFAGGLATVVVLRKCCRVDHPQDPCLPAAPVSATPGD